MSIPNSCGEIIVIDLLVHLDGLGDKAQDSGNQVVHGDVLTPDTGLLLYVHCISDHRLVKPPKNVSRKQKVTKIVEQLFSIHIKT